MALLHQFTAQMFGNTKQHLELVPIRINIELANCIPRLVDQYWIVRRNSDAGRATFQ